MAIVDTHCHASPYWYAPVESLLDEMNRSRVDKAVLIQIGGMYDNSYLIECMRRFPGRFSAVGMVDTDRPNAPEQLEAWVKQGVEGIRLAPPSVRLAAMPLPSGAKQLSWGLWLALKGLMWNLSPLRILRMSSENYLT
jgi:L-fuconolactonase